VAVLVNYSNAVLTEYRTSKKNIFKNDPYSGEGDPIRSVVWGVSEPFCAIGTASS
jgi:hypothetical protein